jgi:hypothetical protein
VHSFFRKITSKVTHDSHRGYWVYLPALPSGRKSGRVAQLVLRDVQLIGVKARTVAQHTLRQGAIFIANTEEATKRHHRIGDLASTFVDHNALNGTQFLAAAATNRRTFDLVTRDQATGFTAPLPQGQQLLS